MSNSKLTAQDVCNSIAKFGEQAFGIIADAVVGFFDFFVYDVDGKLPPVLVKALAERTERRKDPGWTPMDY